MKTNNLLIALGVCLFVSCSKFLHIEGRSYSNISDREYFIESFEFIDKNTCIYKQSFNCALSKEYKEFILICNYSIKGNRLLMVNKYPIDTLKNKIYLRLPESEINKCSYMTRYTIDLVPDERLMIGRPPRFNDGYYIGYYNYFEKVEYLFYDSVFYYKHVIDYPGNRGYEYKTTPYALHGKDIDTLSVIKKSLEINNDETTKINASIILTPPNGLTTPK